MQTTLRSRSKPKWWRPVLANTGMLSILSAACVATYGGTFTSDFSKPGQAGITLNGGTDAAGVDYPVIGTNKLVLVYAENSQSASAVLDDLDGGKSIESFTATFGLNFGPGTGTPADGFSFNFGPDIDSSFKAGEEGAGGPGDLVVEFDTYDNGAPDNIGIDLKVGGTEIATTKMAFATLVDSQVHPVSIQLNKNGTINVAWNNQIIYSNTVLTGWAPINGQFALGARTGCANEVCYIQNLTINTVVAGPVTAPTITTQPQSVTVNEPGPATFSVGYDGTAPFTFQWSVNGVADPAGTNTTYTIPHALFSQNGAKVHVTVTNGSGNKTSDDAILTVTQDKTPPTLVSANSGGNLNGVALTFSEAVDATSGGASANYTITPALAVSAATVNTNNPTVVTLTTAAQAAGTKYTVSVSNVKDLAGNTITAASTKDFFSAVVASGACTERYFANSPGNTIDAMQGDPRYPNGIPDYTAILTDWEYPPYNGPWVAPASGNNEAGANYFNIISGWFIPPKTGNYVFFTCSDDPSNLYLSTDDTPANKKLIAQETGWSNPRSWVTANSGDATTKRSDQFSGTEWPGGGTITLTAGKQYYMQSDHTEGGGGDNVEATFIMAGDPDPVDGSASTLTGAVIGTTVPANGLLASTGPTGTDINPQPAISATLIAGLTKLTTNNVTLKVDGTAVPTTLKTNGSAFTVSYTPTTGFALASKHAAEVDYPLADGSTTNATWSFTVVKTQAKDSVGGVVGFVKGPGGFTADAGGHTGKAGDYAIDSTAKGGTWVDIENIGFINTAATGGAMSMSLWVKKYDIAAGSAFWAQLSKVTTGTDLRGYQSHIPWSDDIIYFDTMGCCDAAVQRIQANINTFAGYTDDSFWTNWHHFVYTMKGANKNIYIDGKLFLNGTSTDTLAPNFVGLGLLTDGIPGGDFMHGLIDDYAVYSTEVTAADAAALFGGASPTSLTGEKVVAYWNFNDPATGGGGGGIQISGITASAGNVTITWTGGGTLQSATTVTGPWTDMTGKTSPATVPASGAVGFFRIKQ